MGIMMVENFKMIVGMVLGSINIEIKILTLENTDVILNMAMAHNIGVVAMRHTQGSIIMTKEQVMEFPDGHREKLIMDSSKMIYMKDMVSSNTRTATSMTDSGYKVKNQAMEYSHLLLERFREEYGKKTN
jgi:hypothetical protein